MKWTAAIRESAYNFILINEKEARYRLYFIPTRDVCVAHGVSRCYECENNCSPYQPIMAGWYLDPVDVISGQNRVPIIWRPDRGGFGYFEIADQLRRLGHELPDEYDNPVNIIGGI